MTRPAEAFPLRATGAAVLVAGFLLALTSFLVAFLLWPPGNTALARAEDPHGDFKYSSGPVLTVYGEAARGPTGSEKGSKKGKDSAMTNLKARVMLGEVQAGSVPRK